MSQVQMGSMATLGGTLGRTMSPIAGATIICAGIALWGFVYYQFMM